MSNRHRSVLPTLGAVLLCWAAAAHPASRLEDHERIRSAAEAHALRLARSVAPDDATVRATAARLDSRLRLPACAAELESFSAAGQTGVPSSVGVRCPADTPWSLYVPVKVEVIADVVVLTTPGARGERVSPDELRLEPRDVSRMTQDYLQDIADLDGMVLKRQVRPGTVLSAALLERERIVHRGERIRLRSGGGLLSVSVEGEALADAAIGDRVRVRNVTSGIVVEGVVEASGLVVMGR